MPPVDQKIISTCVGHRMPAEVCKECTRLSLEPVMRCMVNPNSMSGLLTECDCRAATARHLGLTARIARIRTWQWAA